MKFARNAILATLFALAPLAAHAQSVTGLPPGLSLNSTSATTAEVSGTPTMAGTFAFVIEACDSSNPTNCGTLDGTIVIAPVSSPVIITPITFADGTVKQPYAVTISVSGGSGAGYTWAIKPNVAGSAQ